MASSLSIYTELLDMDKTDDGVINLTVFPKKGNQSAGLVCLLADTIYAIKNARTDKHVKLTWTRNVHSQNYLVTCKIITEYQVRLEAPVAMLRVFVKRLMALGI